MCNRGITVIHNFIADEEDMHSESGWSMVTQRGSPAGEPQEFVPHLSDVDRHAPSTSGNDSQLPQTAAIGVIPLTTTKLEPPLSPESSMEIDTGGNYLEFDVQQKLIINVKTFQLFLSF